jgi:hypothetical protein
MHETESLEDLSASHLDMVVDKTLLPDPPKRPTPKSNSKRFLSILFFFSFSFYLITHLISLIHVFNS